MAGIQLSSRKAALEPKPKTSKNIFPLVTTYNSASPYLKKILMKHWHLKKQQLCKLAVNEKAWNSWEFLGMKFQFYKGLEFPGIPRNSKLCKIGCDLINLEFLRISGNVSHRLGILRSP